VRISASSEVGANSPAELLTSYVRQYAKSAKPVNVEFRQLLESPSRAARATHLLHPYPAKLLVHIPRFFLGSHVASNATTVCDPFCGSGTVLLEALLSGRNAIGADANPLARLISTVKLTVIDEAKLNRGALRLIARIPAKTTATPKRVLNVDYWFYPHVQRDILRIREAVMATRDLVLKRFFMVALSATLKDVSLADPRLSVPVRLRADQYPQGHWLYEKTVVRLQALRHIDVFNVFRKRLDSNIRQMTDLAALKPTGRLLEMDSCSRAASKIRDESVGLLITSPPYLGAQKYVRASSLNLTWLQLCGDDELAGLEALSIGREHFRKLEYTDSQLTTAGAAGALIKKVRKRNPLRAHIASVYLAEMQQALREIYRMLVPGGHAVIVVGASQLCGEKFDTPRYLAEMAALQGLTIMTHLIDPIRSRALMTKQSCFLRRRYDERTAADNSDSRSNDVESGCQLADYSALVGEFPRKRRK
jgi:DNA modification methylase